MDKKYSVTPATAARTAALFLAFVNQILSASGHPVLPIKDEQLEVAVTTCFTIGAGLVAWWKNNSFTQDALAADKWLECLRGKKKED